MFKLRGISRLIVAILGIAAVVAVTAGPASAATGSVQVGPTANIVARGVALDVPVTVSLTCDEGFDVGLVDLSVLQARGTAVIFGSGQQTFTCTGVTQTVTVRAFGGVFHGGTALVTAGLLQCFNDAGGLFCSRTDITTNEETQIRGR
jgi:hypothetical protein